MSRPDPTDGHDVPLAFGDPALDDPPARQPDLRSPGTRLADKLRGLAAAGVQPLTREPARPDLGTCGGCEFRVQFNRGTSKPYPKCVHPETPMTGGPATDVRASWPACHRFVPKDPS